VSRKTQRRVRASTGTSSTAGSQFAGGNRYERYLPAEDRLEEGSIIESWIPTDLPGLNQLFRQIYARDGIAGPAIDIHAMIPWSIYDLVGVDDPHIRRFYEDALMPLFTAETMEEISKEFLSLGRFCGSLVYDMKKGYWTSMLPHDSDFLEIEPIPVKGWDPILDLRPGPGLRKFIMNQDPRAQAALKHVPKNIIDRARAGRIELSPLNTLWVARKVSPYDHVGTSMLTRILPYWAMEKPLLDATVAAARRRAGAILHVSAGVDDKWEPTEEEMANIADIFIRADEDPVGAVVVTRTGVESNEVRPPGSVWKLSDEFSFLSEGKMRALGINDAFLSGEATYTSYEQATSIFMEQVRTFRERMTVKTILKMAEILARSHGFRKMKQAHLDHQIRVKEGEKSQPEVEQPVQPRDEEVKAPGIDPQEELDEHKEEEARDFKLKNLSRKDAMAIPKSQLIIPGVSWAKSLRPEGDQQLFEILTTMEEHGVPVPLREWSQAGGRSINEIMDGLEDDANLRIRINDWRKKVKPPEDDAFASVATASSHPRQLPFWKNGKFLSLRYKEFVSASATLAQKKGILRSPKATMGKLSSVFKGDDLKIELTAYLLMRMGLARGLPISARTSEAIFEWLRKKVAAKREVCLRELLVYSKLVHPEVYANREPHDTKIHDAFLKQVEDKAASSVRHERTYLKNSSPHLLSGLS
jgi:hypothetical protein